MIDISSTPAPFPRREKGVGGVKPGRRSRKKDWRLRCNFCVSWIDDNRSPTIDLPLLSTKSFSIFSLLTTHSRLCPSGPAVYGDKKKNNTKRLLAILNHRLFTGGSWAPTERHNKTSRERAEQKIKELSCILEPHWFVASSDRPFLFSFFSMAPSNLYHLY